MIFVGLFFILIFHSNGSGKSSLAMAALWALTGSLDPRRALDGRVSDVVNDDSKVHKFLCFSNLLLLVNFVSIIFIFSP